MNGPARAQTRVAVTGATGFIGRHLVEELREGGYLVRGLARHPPAGRVGVEWSSIADVTDRESIRRGMESVDAVVHLASRVHVMRETDPNPLRAFRETNVHGTRVVLEEAVGAGAGTFVFVSSIKAVAEESRSPLTEDVEPGPEDPYGISKLEAEDLALELGEGKLRVVILRPPMVYGPGMKGNMLRLFSAVDRGIPLPLGWIENRRSLVYVGNVVAAIRSLLEHPSASGRFFVSDGHDLSTPQLVREIGVALGREPRLWTLPRALVDTGLTLGRALSVLPGVPDPAPIHRRLAGSLRVSMDRLRREVEFEPPFEVHEGLRRTAEWYRTVEATAGSP